MRAQIVTTALLLSSCTGAKMHAQIAEQASVYFTSPTQQCRGGDIKQRSLGKTVLNSEKRKLFLAEGCGVAQRFTCSYGGTADKWVSGGSWTTTDGEGNTRTVSQDAGWVTRKSYLVSCYPTSIPCARETPPSFCADPPAGEQLVTARFTEWGELAARCREQPDSQCVGTVLDYGVSVLPEIAYSRHPRSTPGFVMRGFTIAASAEDMVRLLSKACSDGSFGAAEADNMELLSPLLGLVVARPHELAAVKIAGAFGGLGELQSCAALPPDARETLEDLLAQMQRVVDRDPHSKSTCAIVDTLVATGHSVADNAGLVCARRRVEELENAGPGEDPAAWEAALWTQRDIVASSEIQFDHLFESALGGKRIGDAKGLVAALVSRCVVGKTGSRDAKAVAKLAVSYDDHPDQAWMVLQALSKVERAEQCVPDEAMAVGLRSLLERTEQATRSEDGNRSIPAEEALPKLCQILRNAGEVPPYCGS